MRMEALTIQCATSIPHQTQHFAIIRWDKTYRLMKKFENDVDTSSLQEKYLANYEKGRSSYS